MEIKGSADKKVLLLKPHEEKLSGYSSPIYLLDFDAESERNKAHEQLDALTADQLLDIPDDQYMQGAAQGEFQSALMRKSICDFVLGNAFEGQIPELVETGIAQLEELLSTEDPRQ